jgi:hypothetical protein
MSPRIDRRQEHYLGTLLLAACIALPFCFNGCAGAPEQGSGGASPAPAADNSADFSALGSDKIDPHSSNLSLDIATAEVDPQPVPIRGDDVVADAEPGRDGVVSPPGSGTVNGLFICLPENALYRYVNATPATTIASIPPNWFAVDFDDSEWFQGFGAFGTSFGSNLPNASGPETPNAPGFPGGTAWSVNFAPFLRTYFDLSAPTPLTIWLAVDNGINSLYINGVLATAVINAEGAAFRWEHVIDVPASLTTAGENQVALQLEDHGFATAFAMAITARATAPQLGDLDADGDVDLADYAVLHNCITGPLGPPIGDIDGDHHVTLADFASWAPCLRGPQAGMNPGCGARDLDADSDVDLADFGVLQRQLGATGRLSPICLPADFDHDEDVDLVDFAKWEDVFRP